MHTPPDSMLRPRTPDGDEVRRQLVQWPYWSVIFLLVCAGMAAMTVDMQLGRLAASNGWPEELVEELARAEVFGYGVTAALILLTVRVIDPARHRVMPRVAMMVFGAGLAADGLKLLLGRIRPRDFNFEGSVWATFQIWLWPAGGWKSHSFPSAHTATAMGLAVALSVLYPRGRWLFGLFALLAGFQRIVCGAHFPSDVLWGAAVGWFAAVGIGRLPLAWLRFERLARKRPSTLQSAVALRSPKIHQA